MKPYPARAHKLILTLHDKKARKLAVAEQTNHKGFMVRYNHRMRFNLARGLIGLTILWNLQAALVILVWPDRYTAAYELQGAVGAAALRGIGVLFLMWNVPYLVALWHPVRHRISLFEALAMQTIGIVGEGIIYMTIPANHAALLASVYRFIVFDALGLVLLLIATWITRER